MSDTYPPGASKSTPSIKHQELETFLNSHTLWKLKEKEQSIEPTSANIHMRRLIGKFIFPTFISSIQFVQMVAIAAEQLEHHPNINLVHHCVKGATVELELFTLVTGTITSWDLKAAEEFEKLYLSIVH